MARLSTIACALVCGIAASSLLAPTAQAAERRFEPGSLVIPMDLSYQSTGMFQAYGLIYQLLKQGVHVNWMIDPTKTYHAAPCNTVGNLCAWDCGLEGSGIKCPYPTMSPDITVTSKIVWADAGGALRDSILGTHAYRGGPFVIDALDHDKAVTIIDAWNNQALWTANPWARRTVFHVTTVHEATTAFTGNVGKEMIAPPTIAVFADGNEPIATGYLRAAGIPQSNDTEFPAAKCGATNCGPGTSNPDMLTEEAVAGDLGTCAAPITNHRNGALFKPNGEVAYCQIMSMHWGVNEREKVLCDGGACPATQAECTNQTFTYNGHEVVAEVREFLKSKTHFFAECQAVNAYENTTPNPAWPFLDDVGRDGHFLTTEGTPPACPCTNADYKCVTGGCNGVDCCLPTDNKWLNAGYEVGPQPATGTVKLLQPSLPYIQIDGEFGTTGGSEPSYNLSTYLNTTYKNNRQVTMLTGPNGPGNQDLWMTGFLDGCDDVVLAPGKHRAAGCEGKISYLGGHNYETTVPVVSGSKSQGTRLFLNALFEAQCVTGDGPGIVDTDGDGIVDGNDPFPNDPTQCGDADGDGCDDCSSGRFDPANDCTGGPGANGTASSGCCETGAASPLGSLLLSALVFGVAFLPRRRQAN